MRMVYHRERVLFIWTHALLKATKERTAMAPQHFNETELG